RRFKLGMVPDSLTLIGGLLLGLASTLHCAGMCGAIASSIMFAFSSGERTSERARSLLTAHAGRLLVYVAGGVAVGRLARPSTAPSIMQVPISSSAGQLRSPLA